MVDVCACVCVAQPGGALFVSTLNRTAKSNLLAVFGAERVLGLVPVGTHSWDKFVTPAELAAYLARVQSLGLQGAGGSSTSSNASKAAPLPAVQPDVVVFKDAREAQRASGGGDAKTGSSSGSGGGKSGAAAAASEGNGPVVRVRDTTGFFYHPLRRTWQLSGDTSVNYIVYCSVD